MTTDVFYYVKGNSCTFCVTLNLKSILAEREEEENGFYYSSFHLFFLKKQQLWDQSVQKSKY